MEASVDYNLVIEPFLTLQGLEKFLGGSYIKGIGPVNAKKLAEAFGFDILAPSFNFGSISDTVSGFNAKKGADIKLSFDSLRFAPEAAVLLYSAGFTDAEVEKILSHYGRKTLTALLDDPYDMVENAWKVSFFTADKLGKHIHISPDDPRRIRGALLTAVKFYAEKGSLFATEQQALSTAASLTGATENQIRPQLDNLIKEGRLVRSHEGIYLPVYYNAEKETARKLSKLINSYHSHNEEIILPNTDIEGNPLNASQIEALRTVMTHPVSVITGGPGTGKTTTIRGIIRLFEDLDRKVVLVAPTGRAAKRLSDLAGAEAKTIHRLLGYSMGKGYRNKRFDAGILVIDEASMLEQVIFSHLLDALNSDDRANDLRIVLVGDTNQLPAIGAGDVLNDMIASGRIPVVRLNENFRQKEGSEIAATAEAIRQGITPERGGVKDFILMPAKSPAEILRKVLSLVAREIPSGFGIEPKQIQVVSPQQDGALGARELNIAIQQKVNPEGPGIKRGRRIFRLGDRVMQTANSSEWNIYNGETGWISAVNEELHYLEVTFHDGKEIRYGRERLKELTLAYATTVHKLQGSETDYMVMILSGIHRNMLYRNLLYTAVSRARKLCVLVAEEKAIVLALANESPVRRNSNFGKRLQNAIKEI